MLRHLAGAALALLLGPMLLCGVLLRPAAAEDLKIATWNLDWLTLRSAQAAELPANVHPRSAADFARLAQYAAGLHADIVALEEVDGAEPAARLFPPADYRLVFTADPVVQRTGIAIRQGIGFTRNPDYTALVPSTAAHFPLRSGADITLHLAGGHSLRILAVHLKTGCWWGKMARSQKPACAILRWQTAALARWVAARQQDGVPFLLLGDFNRRMDGADEMLRALDRASHMRRANAGQADPCWGGGGAFIDQILAGNAAQDWLVAGSLQVMVYQETGAEWKDRLSDHCPVSVQVRVPG